MKGLHLDKRLSPIDKNGNRVSTGILSYLEGGCGYGGSCFPKDLKAITSFARLNKFKMPLLDSVIKINNSQINEVEKILSEEFKTFNGLRISILGLAFKPETSDIRESASIKLIRNLLKKKCIISVYDPVAIENSKKIFMHKINYHNSVTQCISESDVVILMTGWKEFENIHKIFNKMKFHPLLIDGRRIVNPGRISNYRGIGYSKKSLQ